MGSKLARAFATAAGLILLCVPSTASASWWDGGGYDGYGRHPHPPGPIEPLYGCENSTLSDTGGGLLKTTTPPPGTPVLPGDEILVEITWAEWQFTGPDLHKVIDCVYIDGLFVPELSGGERPTPNDGHFAFHYIVPDLPPGAEICDQGFVSGPNGWEDYAREVSNVVCFPVEGPPPPPPPCCEAPPPPPPCCEAPAPPPPCCEEAPTTTTMPPTTTTTAVPEEEAEPYTEAVRFDQDETPAPPAPQVEPRDVLPRTGVDTAATFRLAGAALVLAALAGRRSRRLRSEA
jgi:LPXTG-motif cell wall-anchored protein